MRSRFWFSELINLNPFSDNLNSVTEKFVLGTVQIGLPYGRKAGSHLCTENHAEELLQAAWELGVRVFDTALGYGVSISRLANWLKNSNRLGSSSIVTKIPPEYYNNKNKVIKAVEPFFGALSITVLTHGFVNSKHWEIFQKIVTEIGCYSGQSVYTAEELAAAIRLGANLIQAPGNILDSRQITMGKEKKQKMDIRSVFLQGVLLDPPAVANSRAPGMGPIVEGIQICAQRAGLSTSEALIGLMLQEIEPGWRIVLGADNSDEVRQWANCFGKEKEIEHFYRLVKNFYEGDIPEALLDPRCWPQMKEKAGVK